MSQTLQELTLKNNFLFGAVMSDEENCKPLLEMILGFPIGKIEVNKEHNLVYHPEYHGIRMDVYAKDENNTRYNVEMQALPNGELSKRTRYYHSQLDMDLLTSGKDYDTLPNVYVIFICDFDPFEEKRFRYRFENRCIENGELSLQDGSYTIFLSTKGKNDADISPELRNFLKFVSMDLPASETPSEDAFIAQLQKSIQKIKESRKMEERYMLFERLLQDERKAGFKEGIKEGIKEGSKATERKHIMNFLKTKGLISQELTEKISMQQDMDVLEAWVTLSAEVSTVEEFQEKMDQVISGLIEGNESSR